MESQEVSFTRLPPDSVDKTPKVLPLDSRLPPKFQSIKSLPVGLQFVETSHRSKEDEEEVESPYNRSAFFGNFFQDEDDPVSSVSEASSQFPSAPLPGVDSWWSDTSTNGEKKEIKAWCKLQNGEWALGKIVSNTGEDVILSVPKGKVVKVHRDTLLRANPDILDGVDDLMQLSYLNEPSVLYNLQYRYSQNIIYTKSGPVLIAINPYKEVNLYGSEYIRAYRRRSMNKPHVYALTDTAMREMIRDEISQSIIISGESGSGKTETAKIAMQYLVALGGGSGIEYEILQSNPILEAFGNAKTLRNDNSSRFGKLIEIHFSATGRISSARIQTFLLEKSRVVQCSERERSYHIFYQLCAGAPLSLREKLNLKKVDEYEYLKQSKCFQIAGVNDSQSFHEVMKALDAVHISWEDQEKVFAMISAVLWLGNISFTSIDNEDHVEPIIDEGVHTVARLMGCNIEELKLALSTRKMEVHKEQIVKKLTLSQAIDTRDALAKSIYVSLFEWLVEQINKSLTAGKKRTGRYISILDIYGFEYFQKNTFEQFCINYANERLQQHFNRHLFKLEQEEYIQDGIDWEKMDFDDNQDCLNLFEKKPLGLLSLLDEESTFPNATDLSFASKLKKHLCSNPCFRGERGKNFIVRHYAGEVVYDTFGFLEKNRDVLSMDSIQLLSSCSSELPQSFAAKLISQSENSISSLAGDSQKMSATSKFKVLSRVIPDGDTTNFWNHDRQFCATGIEHMFIDTNTSFAQKTTWLKPDIISLGDQLFQLIQRLERTTPHFIRCIKPNKLQLPDIYEQAFTLQQLKCCGVLEVGRISRSGYPTRMPHQKFARRYGFLLLESIASQDPLTVSVAILRQFNIHPEMYHVGYTKLFFRMGQIGALEDSRNRTLHGILRLQSVFRGHRARCNVRNYRNGIVELQSFVRGQKTRAMYNVLVMRLRASVVLQRHIKSKIARREFLNIQKASIIIQTGIRGELVRCLGHVGTKFYDTDQVLVKASVLADLQQRVLKAEAEVKRKEEENESLRKDQEEYNRKWLENENNLRLMEEHWQKQMASLQNNFSLLKKKMMVKGGSERNRFSWSSIMMNGSIKAGSSDTIIGLSNEFAQRSDFFADNAKSLMEVNSNQTEGSSTPQQDLKKLKTSFDTWKKDFNSRLKETKINVNKLGNDENSDVIKKKKWWGRLRTLKNEMSG